MKIDGCLVCSYTLRHCPAEEAGMEGVEAHKAVEGYIKVNIYSGRKRKRGKRSSR
jgi:hypothetical protein